MRNANKPFKIPYSATTMVREVKSDPEFVAGIGSPPKVDKFF